MIKKSLAVCMLAATLVLNVVPTTAFAAKSDMENGSESNGDEGIRGDGSHGGGSHGDGSHVGSNNGENETVYSGTEITIPENILDGNYSGTATVHHDDADDFDDYDITVNVTIKDGTLVTFSVSGVDGRNSAYTGSAQTGILNQLKTNDNGTGTYNIDAVSSATCSSTAIVQGINAALKNGEALSGTYYSMDSDVTYLPSGSYFKVTVHNPEENNDYDITLAYGVGKFSDDLEPKDEYCSVELIEDTETEKVYKVTMKPDAIYEIDDDGITHELYVNDPGTSLAVKVNNENVGSFTIKSSAIPSITNNVLTLTGGNGETLNDYLALVDEVTVTYKDENGEEVTATYTTRWQHDMDPAFTGSDLFNGDGSINFNVIATVTETGDDFEAIQDENGNNVTTDVEVFPYGADWDYLITVTAGDGYEALTANIGASYAADDSENETETKGLAKPSQEDNDIPKTADTAVPAMLTSIFVLAVIGMGMIFVRRKRCL